jgi:hypothetical protein
VLYGAAGVLVEDVAVLLDPAPPLGEGMRLCLARGRSGLLLCAGLFAVAGLAAWKLPAGRSLLARGAVLNAALVVAALAPFLVLDHALRPMARGDRLFVRDPHGGWRL